MGKQTKIAGVIPDCHIPWVDSKALDVCLSVFHDIHRDQGMDEIIIMGDFLDFYWRQRHFPAFNVADSAICVGAGLYVISQLLLKRRTAQTPNGDGAPNG